MIQQNSENGNTQIELNSSFIRTIKEMKISKLLHEANIRKDARTLTGENSGEKRTAFEIFQFLLLMVFQGCNLYRYLGSKRQDIACSKSTYHRFLSDRHYNWKMFITRLAARVIGWLEKLTDPKRFKAFVLDDSFIGRKRSKKVELLSFIFDHVSGRSLPGFNLLTLGWTDGFSFIPVAFNMLASAVKTKRIVDIKEGIDKRTNGYRNRMDAIKQKPEAAIAMIKATSRQLAANPKAEICAFDGGKWLRVAGELINDDRIAPKAAMLEKYPELKGMYSAEDDNTQVLYFRNATATFSSFTEAWETVTF